MPTLLVPTLRAPLWLLSLGKGTRQTALGKCWDSTLMASPMWPRPRSLQALALNEVLTGPVCDHLGTEFPGHCGAPLSPKLNRKQTNEADSQMDPHGRREGHRSLEPCITGWTSTRRPLPWESIQAVGSQLRELHSPLLPTSWGGSL